MPKKVDLSRLTKEQLSVLAAHLCVCTIHVGEPLICPICFSSRGGKITAKKHAKKLSKWGKLGGRPKKKRGKKAKS